MKSVNAFIAYILSGLLIAPPTVLGQQSSPGSNGTPPPAAQLGAECSPFSRNIDLFIKRYNELHPLKSVQISELSRLLEEKTGPYERAQDIAPELVSMADSIVEDLYKCAKNENEFTGILYGLLDRQFDFAYLDNEKSMDSYRPLLLLREIIGEKFFSPEDIADRQANKESFLHNLGKTSLYAFSTITALYMVSFLKGRPFRNLKDQAKIQKASELLKKEQARFDRLKETEALAARSATQAKSKFDLQRGTMARSRQQQQALEKARQEAARLSAEVRTSEQRLITAKNQMKTIDDELKSLQARYESGLTEISLKKLSPTKRQKQIDDLNKQYQTARSPLLRAKEKYQEAINIAQQTLQKTQDHLRVKNEQIQQRETTLRAQTQRDLVPEGRRMVVHPSAGPVTRTESLGPEVLKIKRRDSMDSIPKGRRLVPQSTVRVQSGAQAPSSSNGRFINLKDNMKFLGSQMKSAFTQRYWGQEGASGWLKFGRDLTIFTGINIGAAYTRQHAYKKNWFEQLPTDYQNTLYQQNYLLALQTYCDSATIKNEVARNTSHASLQAQSQKINELSIAYSLILKPTAGMLNKNAPEDSTIEFLYGGQMPKDIMWDKDSGAATSTIGTQVECPLFKGVDRNHVKVSISGTRENISDAARQIVNSSTSWPYQNVLSQTQNFITQISQVLKDNREKRYQLDQQNLTVQMRQKGDTAASPSTFDLVIHQFTDMRIQSFNATEGIPTAVDPISPAIGASAQRLAKNATALDAHEFNRWILKLGWDFVKNADRRFAIQAIWNALIESENKTRDSLADLQGEEKTVDASEADQRLAATTFAIGLLLGDGHLMAQDQKLKIFDVYSAEKSWAWLTESITEIEGQVLKSSWATLQAPWVNSTLIKNAFIAMADGKDSVFYNRWIKGENLSTPIQNIENTFAMETLKNVITMLPLKKVSTTQIAPLFIALASQKVSCEMKEIQERWASDVSQVQSQDSLVAFTDQLAKEWTLRPLPLHEELSELGKMALLADTSSSFKNGISLGEEPFICVPINEVQTLTPSPTATVQLMTEQLAKTLATIQDMSREFNRDFLSSENKPNQKANGKAK